MIRLKSINSFLQHLSFYYIFIKILAFPFWKTSIHNTCNNCAKFLKIHHNIAWPETAVKSAKHGMPYQNMIKKASVLRKSSTLGTLCARPRMPRESEGLAQERKLTYVSRLNIHRHVPGPSSASVSAACINIYRTNLAILIKGGDYGVLKLYKVEKTSFSTFWRYETLNYEVKNV